MLGKNFTTLQNRPSARASRSRCQRHRKRESRHHVSGCNAVRIRLRCRSRDDGKRFIVGADEKLAAFVELERAIYEFEVDLIS